MNNSKKYSDIIDMPHYVSKKHSQMSIENRAAQFAPFAALTGFDDIIKETARITEKRKTIDEGLKMILNQKLQLIEKRLPEKQKITFTYFVPDAKKEGGRYVTVTGVVKEIHTHNKSILLENKTYIPISEIIDINVENN